MLFEVCELFFKLLNFSFLLMYSLVGSLFGGKYHTVDEAQETENNDELGPLTNEIYEKTLNRFPRVRGRV